MELHHLTRFWQYGKFVNVTIDDRLPTYNGELVFIKSSSKNEFWAALVEKAYAKLHGSYEHLEVGYFSEALVDFTGGCPEFISLTKDQTPRHLFSTLLNSNRLESHLGCSIFGGTSSAEENGLVTNHAYTITNVLRFEGIIMIY